MTLATTKFRKPRTLVFGAVAIVCGFVSQDAGADTYIYDALGRVTSVTNDVGVVTYYCYDKAGNRTYVGPTPCP
jgi:YD repeat-containing protein